MTESDQLQAGKPAFIKYPKILALDSLAQTIPLDSGTEVSIFEKIDGGNCQVRNNNWQLLPGSRAHYLTKIDTEALDWFKKFCKWTYSNHSLYKLPNDLVLFGEWSGNHTIQYGLNFSDRFFLIDTFDLKSRRFMEYEAGAALLHNAGIEGVDFLEPLFKGGIEKADINRLIMEPSKYYAGPKEGVVVKEYGINPQAYFKAYHPDFAESRDSKEGIKDHLTSIRFRKAFYGICEEIGASRVHIEKLIETVALNVKDEHALEYSQGNVVERLNEHLASGKLSDISKHLIF